MLSFIFLMGCNGEKEPVENETTDTAVPSAGDVTWHQGIHKLIAENCQRCHSSDSSLTFPLEEHQLVSAMGSVILDKIQGSDRPPFFMPPFNAVTDNECTPPLAWKHNPRLSPEEVEMFSAWVDADYPMGDEATAYAIETPSSTSLTGDNVQTLTSTGHTITPSEVEDQYRCFSLDPALSQKKWITALEVLPGNSDIVHHVVLFSDPTGASASMAAAEGSYDCYGSAGVPDSGVLMAWAPGGEPMQMPENSGFAVEPGERIVAQVHYHPVYGSTDNMVDQTGLNIEWSEEQPDKTVLYEVLGGIFENNVDSPKWDDPPFAIPAGASGHIETWREPMNQIPNGADIRIFGIFPHMHMLGRSIRISIDHADGTSTCLNHIPNYDFEWQLTYLYDGSFTAFPQISSTDTLVIECEYDNSESNPFFQEYLATAGLTTAVDVSVGENTLDEMCTGIIGIVY